MGGEAYSRVASRFMAASGYQAAAAGCDCSELNEASGEGRAWGAIEEPNDSERFISGGERSEETVICVGGVLWGVFAMLRKWLCINSSAEGLPGASRGGLVFMYGGRQQ